MISPFDTHRSKVLGHYGTSAWLRCVVMSLWNGSNHQVRLDKVSGLDQEHFTAFVEMIQHYRLRGEGDPAFQTLVRDVKARMREDEAAAERSTQFEIWLKDVKTELRALKKPIELIDDRYTGFEQRFDAGETPDAAAAGCEVER